MRVSTVLPAQEQYKQLSSKARWQLRDHPPTGEARLPPLTPRPLYPGRTQVPR